jgi:hypothetical protein
MACDLQTTLTAACSSGIAKLSSPVELLQVIAQTLCSADTGTPVDPYDGNLTYIQQGGAITVEVNPIGARNLSALVPKVTEIHCHNCPLITSLTCTNDNLLTVLDLAGCPALETLVFNNCTALPSVTLDSSFVTMTNINFESCSSLASFIANSVTTVSGSVNLRSLTGGTHFNITTFSMTALVSTGGSFFFYPGSGEAAQPSPASLSFPNLVSVGGYFIAANLSSLTSFSAPVLTSTTQDFNISNCAPLATVSVGSLSSVGGTLYANSNPGLATISFPALASAGNINIYTCANITSINLSALLSVNQMYFTGCDNLVSVDLTLLEECGLIDASFNDDLSSFDLLSLVNGFVPTDIYLNNCVSLTDFNISALLEAVEGTYDFSGSSLDQPSVDSIFLFGLNGGTTGAIYHCDGGANSAPSATGIGYYNTLLALGNDVTKN